ncbi:MAG TPA: hypothetical protein VFO79_01500, partial [Xanthomonadales bacterium]|nr:hypothetical protein [Xanthomonadales bacterium]
MRMVLPDAALRPGHRALEQVVERLQRLREARQRLLAEHVHVDRGARAKHRAAPEVRERGVADEAALAQSMRRVQRACVVCDGDFRLAALDHVQRAQRRRRRHDRLARRVVRLADRVRLHRAEMREIARKHHFPGPVETDLELLRQRRDLHQECAAPQPPGEETREAHAVQLRDAGMPADAAGDAGGLVAEFARGLAAERAQDVERALGALALGELRGRRRCAPVVRVERERAVADGPESGMARHGKVRRDRHAAALLRDVEPRDQRAGGRADRAHHGRALEPLAGVEPRAARGHVRDRGIAAHHDAARRHPAMREPPQRGRDFRQDLRLGV